MATVVVPFRGSDPKRRLDARSARDRARARRGDARRRPRRRERASARCSSSRRRRRAARRCAHVADPRRGQGAAVRAALDAAVAAGLAAPYLVVNADLPCVTARDLLALAGAVPDGGLALAAAADGTTNALALADARALRAALRPRQRRRASPRSAPSRAVDAPNLVDDVDTLDDLARLAARLGAAHPARARGAASSGRRRERRRPLGRRRRRAVPARPPRCRRSRQRFHRRQRRGRPRGARAARLARPRQHPLHAHRARRRGARLGPRRRDLARARDGRAARRRVVVPARRPRHRPAPRAHAAPARGRRRSRRRRSGSRTRSGSSAALLPATDDPCARSSRRPRGRSRSRRGSSRAATATRSMRCTTPARPRRRPAPGVLEALGGADVILFAPSNPYVSIGPILAVDEIRAALERRRVPCVAISPLVGGRAVKGPADRMLARLAGGTTPAHVASCYEGLIDVLVVDEADEPAAPIAGFAAHGRHEDADDGRGSGAQARGRRGACLRGARVKVAILGGTGSFGRALAARLVALGEDDIVIGSRDASARAGNRRRARRRARHRGDERGGGAWGRPGGARRQGGRCARHGALGRERARSYAAPQRRERDRVPQRRRDAARPGRAQPGRARRRTSSPRPVVAGLHSVAAANLEAQPDEDALVCGDDADAKELALELAAKLVTGRALDAGPLASARALEGLTAVIVNLNRRYKAHAGVRVTGVE